MTDLIERVEDTPTADVGLTEDDHAVIRRCVERQPKLFIRGQHEGYYVHSDVSDLIDIIGRLSRPASPDLGEVGRLTAGERNRIEAALYMVGNPSAWDDYDEGASETIRDLCTLLAKLEGA